jgi:hypothetical protein
LLSGLAYNISDFSTNNKNYQKSAFTIKSGEPTLGIGVYSQITPIFNLFFNMKDLKVNNSKVKVLSMGKKILFVLAGCFFIGSGVYAQVRNKVAVSEKILWQAPVETKGEDGSTQRLLTFKGAIFSPQKGNLPLFNKKFLAPANTSGVQAQLVQPSYQPLSTVEKDALDLTRVGDQIEITTEWVKTKQRPYFVLTFVPIRKNPSTGVFEKLVSFGLSYQYRQERAPVARSFSYTTESELNTGTWFKVAVTKDGVYKLDRQFFKSQGVDISTLDPRNIRVFGTGGKMLSFSNQDERIDDIQELAIAVKGEQDGVLDSLDFAWFYAKGPNRWSKSAACPGYMHQLHLYSDTSYYFVTIDKGAGKRILTKSSVTDPSNQSVVAFDDYQFYENEAVNVVKSGRNWLGETFDLVTTYNFPFNFPDAEPGSTFSIKASVAARSRPASSFTITCQGNSFAVTPTEVNLTPYWADPITMAAACNSFPVGSGNFNVTVKFNKNPGFSSAIGYLDYLELVVRRQLKLSGNEMHFRDAVTAAPGNIADFYLANTSSSTLVLDVSDLFNVTMLETQAQGGSLQFRQRCDTIVEYFAFNEGSNALGTPVSYGSVPNQNLHAVRGIDYIIVAHSLFWSQAQRLAALHEANDGLSSLVVTPQMIYNEFSGGNQDVTAIKHFMKMLYDQAGSEAEKPKYLLLFGDASYRNRSRSIVGNTNFVPCYESANSISYINSYVTDDYFGLLDDNAGEGLAEEVKLGIGRLPVKTAEEAKRVVDKIAAYLIKPRIEDNTVGYCSNGSSVSSGDWKNIICFVADDEDQNLHLRNADFIANAVDTLYPDYNIEKIFIDAYKQQSGAGGKRYPDAKNAINQRVNRGALLVNYTGHGGETGWTEERILEIVDVDSWTNFDRLPLFVTATCEFSRFDDPGRTSAGEEVILHGAGGGIGLLTTTRLVYANYNQTLNENFFDFVFLKDTLSGKYLRVGDICRLTKNASATTQAVNHRNFTLLGDPAIRLNYPENKVITLTLNGTAITNSTDTVSALSKITVTGMLADGAGNKLSNFNGIVYPTVYDKESVSLTLANDPQSLVTGLKSRKSIIYRGKVSVVNGEFSFSFVVPKDINYQFGPGRFSYYAITDGTDGHGSNEQFIVGGTNPNAPKDEEGPTIQLYMNDEKFVSGSITDEDPDLLGILFDENGINTVGNGIGHDLVAILDENTEKAINLNDYYQSDLNSYQKGMVRYPFYSLSDGKHTLSLKVWDVYNNSNTAVTEFVVASSSRLALDKVLNYPNPFTTHTRFMFEHNKPCDNLDVNIQIFTVSGKLIKTLETMVKCEGYRSEDITWDGKDDFGDNIGKGVYVYRLKVTAPDGTWADKFEKLVVLR